MKDLNKEIKVIKIIFQIVSIIVMIVGLGFSYLVAELEDAPGMIFIGTTMTAVGTLFVYGIGEIVIQLKKNNAILSDIYTELKNRR